MAERTKKAIKRSAKKAALKKSAKSVKKATKAVKKKAKAAKKAVKKPVKRAKKAVEAKKPSKVGAKRFQGQLKIMEAVEQLSNFIQDSNQSSKKEMKGRATSKQEGAKEASLENVTNAFKTVHSYMRHLCRKGKKELKGLKAQRGVKAIMLMASEAGKKIEKLQDEKKSKSTLEVFNKLCAFYQEKMVKRFQEQMNADDLWEEEWEGGNMNLDLEHKGLRDLNTVKRDDSYELFYLKQDDGSPFFNRSLLRHIKLVHEFDESFDNDLEDPLLKIHRYRDILVHKIALVVKEKIEDKAAAFYREIAHHKKFDVVKLLHSTLLSLLMACKSYSLSKNTSKKIANEYFADFLSFFRQVLSTREYQQILSGEMDETDMLSKVIFDLIFEISYGLYTAKHQIGFVKDFIDPIMKRAGESDWKAGLKALNTPELISELSSAIDQIDKHLNLFPSGPLLKSFDLLTSTQIPLSFDPFLLSNYPELLFTVESPSKKMKVLRVPSPTRQQYTSKAEALDEFIAFLNALQIKKEKLLYINLQNSLSWKEHARCQEITRMGLRKEYEQCLSLVSLNKGSEFYNQSAEYEEMDQADIFLKVAQQQLLSHEGSGYSFPKQVEADVESFIKKLLPLMHDLLFKKSKSLKRKDRMDFIEIAYTLITLKVISLVKPDHLCFSCKDGVDKGMHATYSFYIALKILRGDSHWKDAEINEVLTLLFGPALLVRERVVDSLGFHRVSSALFVLLQNSYDAGGSFEKIKELYPKDFIKKLKYV